LCKLDVVVEQLCNIHEVDVPNLLKADSKIARIYEAVENKKDDLTNENKKCRKLADYRIIQIVLYKLTPEEHGRMWRVFVPKNLQKNIMAELHVSAGSHLGFLRTWHLLKSKYYWHGMYRMLWRFIQACNVCQFANTRCAKTPRPMQLVNPPLKPFERIGIDFVGPFPSTHPHRNKYIFVMIDHLTRCVEAKPCKAADSKNVIANLKENIVFRHSCPSVILCDNSSSFRCAEFSSFASKYGIRLLFTTAYHPNPNGICERVNGTLKRIIGKMVNAKHDDWDQFVSKAAFSINIMANKITKLSPFYMPHGREPNLRCDVKLKLTENYLDDDTSNFVC